MVTRRHSKKAGNSKKRHSKSRKGGFLGMSRGPPKEVFTRNQQVNYIKRYITTRNLVRTAIFGINVESMN